MEGSRFKDVRIVHGSKIIQYGQENINSGPDDFHQSLSRPVPQERFEVVKSQPIAVA